MEYFFFGIFFNYLVFSYIFFLAGLRVLFICCIYFVRMCVCLYIRKCISYNRRHPCLSKWNVFFLGVVCSVFVLLKKKIKKERRESICIYMNEL